MDLMHTDLSQVDVVSFDMFDTLVYRRVGKPYAVFELMEEELCKTDTSTYRDFASRRRQAEVTAREKSSFQEITLEEIYDDFDLDDKEAVKALEKRWELEVSEPNPEMKAFFHTCLKAGKRVVICSDMYLDRNIIEEILEKNGLDGYDKLYLSSETRKTKHSGDLFQVLIKAEKVNAERVLHIGDNYRSDYLQARKQGLKAFNYPQRKYIQLPEGSAYKALYGSMPKEFPKGAYWDEVGKYSLGNFLFGFTAWLCRELDQGNFDRVFFLSRDGYIMKKAAEKMASTALIDKFSYLYASRRSLIVPTLHLHDSYEERCGVMFWKKRFTIKDYIENFGLSYERYCGDISDIVGDGSELFSRDELLTNSKLHKCYNVLRTEINDNSRREYDLLLAYLRQEHFEGKVAIVDTGWFGNLQNAIVTICQSAHIPVDIHGYYIGIREKCKYFGMQQMNGFLYFNHQNLELQRSQERCNAIVEAFFSRDEGSTRCYERTDGQIVPVLKKNTLEDPNRHILRVIQASALEQVERLSRVAEAEIRNYEPAVYFHGFYRIGIEPTAYDARVIAGFVEEQDIHGTLYYLLHPNRLKKDTYELGWKLGQLKRILHLKLDYMKIYSIMDR